MDGFIRIEGARENNLQNVSLAIPRNAFNVFTGLSGSGKTSLAFDTIYAEGQRRYMESLSAYARQFLGRMDKPDVDSIEGLSPAVSIDQKTTNRNPRSTVGTVTEIFDYMRLLFARVGVPHCPNCGREIKSQPIDTIIGEILSWGEGERVILLAPAVRGEKGTFRKYLDDLAKDGYARAEIDGEIVELPWEGSLDKNKKHSVSVVIDRLVLAPAERSRLFDSVQTASKLAGGLVVARCGEREVLFSENLACPECGVSMGKPEPRDFSFNSPFGMCQGCNGLGYNQQLDPSLVIPDPSLSLAEGALPFYNTDEDGYYFSAISAVAAKHGFPLTSPISAAPRRFMEALMTGDDSPVEVSFNSYFSGPKTQRMVFEGVLNNMARRYRETSSEFMKERIERYMTLTPCPECGGKRLNKNSLAVTVGGRDIISVTELSVLGCRDFMAGLELDETQAAVARMILREIDSRLGFLGEVGLGYLTLSRSAASLSGGESQRIRLATQIGSQLTGVLYVLDEPSIGLHQRDNARLIAALRRLTDLGNTLIVVEHDEETMRASDFIVDVGPGAGLEGGRIVAAGTPEQIAADPASITGQYLSGRKFIPVPKRTPPRKAWLTVRGARANNLQGVDASFPVGLLTCVTGVSGSGKSSLVNDVLYKAAAAAIHRAWAKPGAHASIEGLSHIDKAVAVDQSPIGRTPRSNPATYTGVFDLIRDVFASTPDARVRGYKKGRFSFNVKGGRCEKCSGDGIIRIEMHFLPDVYIPCEVCLGKRYNSETLAVRYKGKSIADVLDMTVAEADAFFAAIPKIRDKTRTLCDVGLGYMKLGQASTTLSGGEAQRVKLAFELSKRATAKTLYVLDEPTTGLHSEDVSHLLGVLFRLRDQGNTIIVIEHNIDVIKSADWIIDLGPEGGSGGGLIVAQGTPEEVAGCADSFTGQFLKRALAPRMA